VQVPWPAYDASNGETYVAVGDLDGDGAAEIVAGLGAGGLGHILIIEDLNNGLAPIAWRRTGSTSRPRVPGNRTAPSWAL